MDKQKGNCLEYIKYCFIFEKYVLADDISYPVLWKYFADKNINFCLTAF